MNNTVVLVGRLTRDIELRYTTNGKAVTDFSIAVTRDKENTDFINIQLWGKVAETTAEYCQKGDMIGVRGSLRHDVYEDKDGNKKSRDYVLASNITFLSTNKKQEESKEKKTNSQALMEAIVEEKDPYEEMREEIENGIDLPF